MRTRNGAVGAGARSSGIIITIIETYHQWMTVVFTTLHHVQLIICKRPVLCGKQHIHTIHICIGQALHIAMPQRPYGALRGAIEWIVVWYPPVISTGIGVGLQVETQYFSF